MVEIELEPAQLEQILGEIAELRRAIATLRADLQSLRDRVSPEEWRA